jgi:hypothetical protein
LEVIEAPPAPLHPIKDKCVVVATFDASLVNQDRMEVVGKVFELAESVLDFLFNGPQFLEGLFSSLLHLIDE